MPSITGGTLTLAVFDESTGWSLSDKLGARLAERAGDAWDVRAVSSRAALLEALAESTGLVGLPLTEEQVRPHCGRLRWVQLVRSAGDASPSIESLLGAGVRVSSAASARAGQVAEHALALLFALLRRLDLALARQREHAWGSRELAPVVRTLSGSTLTVVAPPALLKAISAPARALGARVVACVIGEPGVERHMQDHADRAFPLDAINDALAGADSVIVGAPRLERTHHLVGRKQLGAMHRDTLLVDVSRGGVVDQDALVDALRKGRIASAALDVFESEPLPPTSPFWTMPNVLLTPHIAAAGERFWERLIEQAGDNARRAVAGEPLIDEMAPAMILEA